jgi:hypothetical protein
MAEVTYYVALPFVAADDGVAAGEPVECFNPAAVVMRAEALSRRKELSARSRSAGPAIRRRGISGTPRSSRNSAMCRTISARCDDARIAPLIQHLPDLKLMLRCSAFHSAPPDVPFKLVRRLAKYPGCFPIVDFSGEAAAFLLYFRDGFLAFRHDAAIITTGHWKLAASSCSAAIRLSLHTSLSRRLAGSSSISSHAS